MKHVYELQLRVPHTAAARLKYYISLATSIKAAANVIRDGGAGGVLS